MTVAGVSFGSSETLLLLCSPRLIFFLLLAWPGEYVVWVGCGGLEFQPDLGIAPLSEWENRGEGIYG